MQCSAGPSQAWYLPYPLSPSPSPSLLSISTVNTSESQQRNASVIIRKLATVLSRINDSRSTASHGDCGMVMVMRTGMEMAIALWTSTCLALASLCSGCEANRVEMCRQPHFLSILLKSLSNDLVPSPSPPPTLVATLKLIANMARSMHHTRVLMNGKGVVNVMIELMK